MKITRKEVEHVARLSRLALTPAEIDGLTGQMDQLLGYVEKLDELNTDSIMPTAHAVPMENAFRVDEVKSTIGLERALQNAPLSEEGFFLVPKVIE
ncbi:MAG: Asp-tRNA(Asn)/Glu-tRNA(Gln) amidotransferase subunit GatC [Geopsychrobacter sp.]|nr:Asp-tRNA(Asn)/Glu-tRNA(Gln) amidotransferase subunit GatC [Geopsychrobacter sp.]